MLAGGPWFCVLPAEAWPEGEEAAAELRADFAPCVGDRRQELVFIGEHACALVDGSLLLLLQLLWW
jgi:hypothetical protein